jgi:transposase
MTKQHTEVGAVNGERFEEFLEQIATRRRGKLFVVDNAQIYKRDSVRRTIRDSGNEMLYTLPYSPRLNQIEQFFNQMKFYMKLTKAMTIQALKDSVKEAIDKVRPENYQNYFAYAYDRKQLTRLDKGVSTKHRPLKIYKD